MTITPKTNHVHRDVTVWWQYQIIQEDALDVFWINPTRSISAEKAEVQQSPPTSHFSQHNLNPRCLPSQPNPHEDHCSHLKACQYTNFNTSGKDGSSGGVLRNTTVDGICDSEDMQVEGLGRLLGVIRGVMTRLPISWIR